MENKINNKKAKIATISALALVTIAPFATVSQAVVHAQDTTQAQSASTKQGLTTKANDAYTKAFNTIHYSPLTDSTQNSLTNKLSNLMAKTKVSDNDLNGKTVKASAQTRINNAISDINDLATQANKSNNIDKSKLVDNNKLTNLTRGVADYAKSAKSTINSLKSLSDKSKTAYNDKIDDAVSDLKDQTSGNDLSQLKANVAADTAIDQLQNIGNSALSESQAKYTSNLINNKKLTNKAVNQAAQNTTESFANLADASQNTKISSDVTDPSSILDRGKTIIDKLADSADKQNSVISDMQGAIKTPSKANTAVVEDAPITQAASQAPSVDDNLTNNRQDISNANRAVTTESFANLADGTNSDGTQGSIASIINSANTQSTANATGDSTTGNSSSSGLGGLLSGINKILPAGLLSKANDAIAMDIYGKTAKNYISKEISNRVSKYKGDILGATTQDQITQLTEQAHKDIDQMISGAKGQNGTTGTNNNGSNTTGNNGSNSSNGTDNNGSSSNNGSSNGNGQLDNGTDTGNTNAGNNGSNSNNGSSSNGSSSDNGSSNNGSSSNNSSNNGSSSSNSSDDNSATTDKNSNSTSSNKNTNSTSTNKDNNKASDSTNDEQQDTENDADADDNGQKDVKATTNGDSTDDTTTDANKDDTDGTKSGDDQDNDNDKKEVASNLAKTGISKISKSPILNFFHKLFRL